VKKSLAELRALRTQLSGMLAEWDVRLRRSNGKRADLLYGLERLTMREKTKKKGFIRK